MSKKKIESFIPDALDLVEAHLEKNKTVPKVYKSYISSMGAAMIQSGLLPTLAIFSAPQSESSAGDKRKLIRVLTELLKGYDQTFYGGIPEVNKGKEEDSRLLKFAADFKGNPNNLRRIRRDLTDASIALKLTLRTFKLV